LKEVGPLEKWTWGLSLIALTMAIHTTGIAFLAFATERIRVRLESLNRLSLRRVFAIVIGLMGVAVFCWLRQTGQRRHFGRRHISDLARSTRPDRRFSTLSIRSSPAARRDFMLDSHWRLPGALKATDGMLLFGISTAYIFTVILACWAVVIRPHLPAG
jgi:hypothetical protein